MGVLVLPMRVPPHCFRLASLAENTTAQRSVVYLDRANTFWFYRCVFRPTVFVLLRSPKTQPPGGRLPTLINLIASEFFGVPFSKKN
ncbi:MAG: hypothetical protein LBQ66_07645 [Planctomycetaceae bacterium]|nr:hypothetical protein [Planctomycetaceae bacterium]